MNDNEYFCVNSIVARNSTSFISYSISE